MDTFNAFNPEPDVEKTSWFTGRTFTTFLIGLVIGFALNSFIGGSPFAGDEAALDESTEKSVADVAAVGLGGISEDKTTSVQSNGENLSLVAEGENILVVSNQPSGDKVIISMVSIGVNGWVAVHENVGEALGNILGARRFTAGKYFGETVELLRGTVEDGNYSLVLHADDGDSEFDYAREAPLKDKKGSLISAEFIATAPLVE